MARTMALPKIGVNLEEILLTRWLVKVGDLVNEGDPILEAETDKATQEFYATEGGILAALLVSEGDKVAVGANIAIFVDIGEEYIEPEAGSLADADEPMPANGSDSYDTPKNEIDLKGKEFHVPEERIRISPLALKLTKNLGVDPALLSSKVSGRRITAADVRAYAQTEEKGAAGQTPFIGLPEEKKAVISGTGQRTKSDGIRKAIGTRMSQSAREKPTAALTVTAEAGALLLLRENYKTRGIPLSIDAALVRIAAAALKSHPYINAWFENEEIVIKERVNIGVAMDTAAGLIVPVVKDADNKTLAQIGTELAELSKKTIEGRIAQEEISGGTFTITNLGMFGVEEFIPIINPPECAILAAGAITSQFCPDEEGNPILKKLIKLTLVFDHRIVDGAPAARFLKDFKQYLECPELML